MAFGGAGMPTFSEGKDLESGGALEMDSMHDDRVTGVMSILGTMHTLAKLESKKEVQAGTFKTGIIQWSMAYAVAYALILTIAFTFLIEGVNGTPPDEFTWPYARPKNDIVDTIVPVAFYFFSALSAMDSAWGMILCAEWGVRTMAVPACYFENFISHLHPGTKKAQANKAELENTMWILRCFEPRAVHPGLNKVGCFFNSKKAANGIGFAQNAAWDPFYFIDRSVFSLFVAITCAAYLNQGFLAAIAVAYVAILLWWRIKTHAHVIVDAVFSTIADAKAAEASAGGIPPPNVPRVNPPPSMKRVFPEGGEAPPPDAATAE